jgi:hypothetical protein
MCKTVTTQAIAARIFKVVDSWRKDGQREEIMTRMIIYELLGRHPRIVTYHGHDPVTFELLLQHLPNGDLNGYLQQHLEVPFQNRPRVRSPSFQRCCME